MSKGSRKPVVWVILALLIFGAFFSTFAFVPPAKKAKAAGNTIYVKWDAAGLNNGTSWTDAYTTIQAAVTAVANGDTIEVWAGTYDENLVIGATQSGKSFTVHGGNGGTVTLSKASGVVVTEQVGYASGSTTFSAMTIVGTGTSTAHYSKAGASVLSFISCNLGSASNAGSIFLTVAGATGSISTTGCTIVHNNTTAAVSLASLTDFTISGGMVTTGNAHFISIGANVGAITWQNATFDVTAMTLSDYPFYFAGAFSTGAITISGCTYTYATGFGLYITRGAASVSITDNVVINTSNTGPSVGICVGTDGTTAPAAPKIGPVTVERNTVTYTGTKSSHGILVGRGVTAGTVRNNVVSGADYGLVMKGSGVTVENNVFVNSPTNGSAGVFFRGSSGNTVRHNTFYVQKGYGVLFDTQDALSSENTDATVPTNSATVAVQATVSTIPEGGNITLLTAPNQPQVAFVVRPIIYNPTAGALNLYEGTTTFTVTGTYNGGAVSENITFTSTAGNKSLAASKCRYKTGMQLFDVVTSITLTNRPALTLAVRIGTAGTLPFGNFFQNNIVAQTASNASNMIQDQVNSIGDGNADANQLDYNIYLKGTGHLASLNYGGVSPTTKDTLADLRSAWATYSATYPNNDAHSIAVDPQFVTPGTDFHLLSSSPAIGAASDGTDIGAYQYVPVVSAPTLSSPTTNSINVAFSANGNPDLIQYAIYNETASQYVQADGTLGAGAVWQTRTAWGGDGGKANTGLLSNISYTYKVKARGTDHLTETALSGGTSVSTLAASTSINTSSPKTGLSVSLKTVDIEYKAAVAKANKDFLAAIKAAKTAKERKEAIEIRNRAIHEAYLKMVAARQSIMKAYLANLASIRSRQHALIDIYHQALKSAANEYKNKTQSALSEYRSGLRSAKTTIERRNLLKTYNQKLVQARYDLQAQRAAAYRSYLAGLKTLYL